MTVDYGLRVDRAVRFPARVTGELVIVLVAVCSAHGNLRLSSLGSDFSVVVRVAWNRSDERMACSRAEVSGSRKALCGIRAPMLGEHGRVDSGLSSGRLRSARSQ